MIKMKPNKILRFSFLFLSSILIVVFSTCNTNTGKTGETKNPNGRNDLWEHVGIGGGGSQYFPTISPHNQDIVFESCDMGGSYVTYNGGKTWRMFHLDQRALFFVFDPVDPNVVYANGTGLYKSIDQGNTWSLFYPKPSEITGKVSVGDHGYERLVTKDRTIREVQALAIDPTQSEKLFAAIKIDQSIAFYVSDNGGEDWKKERDLSHDVKSIFIDPTSPSDRRTVYVAKVDGVDQWEAGNWYDHGLPKNDLLFNSFAAGYDQLSKNYILYAVSGQGYHNKDKIASGIYFSEDGGKTWINRQDGIFSLFAPVSDDPEWRAIATCAAHPEVLYVSYSRLITHPDTTYSGVAKSEDFGKTWTVPWVYTQTKSGTTISPNFGRDWLYERFDSPWGGIPICIGVSPLDPDLLYCTDYGRTIKSANGGKTWESVYSIPQPGGGWTTNGMEVTTGYTIVFDPFDENHVFLALTDIGLIESTDGGKSWLSTTKNNGVPRRWVNTTYWITLDAEVKGRGWSVMSYNHDFPRPKMWRDQEVSKYEGGILLTNDSGKTWEVVSSSIGEAAMTHIMYDPTSDKNSRTLYACAFGRGVYKSTDGGKSWTQKNKGIEGVEPFAFRIERRESDGTLFLVVSRRSEDGSIGNEWDGAVYKSVDGAENWIKMTLPEGCNGPIYVLTDVKNRNGLLLAAWGKLSSGKFDPDTGGGIFYSEDDGKTWTQVMKNDQHIHDLTFDMRNNRYYACGFNASAYYSEDYGRTWNRIKGYNFKWGQRVDPDPRDPEKIFIITFGGGTWYGPAKGDENALEDIITPIKRL